MIYVASPYSHHDDDARHHRYVEVRDYMGGLYERGILAYSPICHCHPIAEEYELPKDFSFWAEMDERILSVCTEVHVLELDGWEYSAGVKAELAIADKMGLPVKYVVP